MKIPGLENLKPREQKLVVATVGALIVFLAFQFLAPVDEAEAEADPEAVDVATLDERFQGYLTDLEKAGAIIREYQRNEVRLPEGGGGGRADLVFSDQIARLVSESGFRTPGVEVPRISEIDDVDEYELISTTVRAEGTFEETQRLLRVLDRNGLILREVELNAVRDRDLVRGRFVVARISPVPQEILERRRRRSSGRF
ncbi:MAG: hypothetical protein SF028_04905 [Candidatus Sumerlaeia bacterium]|nr:hypothetical protein [Candidatus Sumerlaeia bacterium]